MATTTESLSSFEQAPPMQQLAQMVPQEQPIIPATPPQRETLPQLQSIAPAEQAVSNSSVTFGGFGERKVMPEMRPATKIPTGLKILSTISALKGDLGPMMGLMQQERKAKFWNEFQNSMPEINRKAGKGDTEGALKLFNEALGRLGTANPEAAALMQPLQAKIYEKEEVLQASKSAIVQENLRYAQLPPEQQDDPKVKLKHKAIVDGYKEMGNLSTKRSADDFFNRSMKMKTQPAPWAGVLAQEDELGNITYEIPPHGFDPQNLKGRVGDTLSMLYELTPNEIVNILNNKNSPMHKRMVQDYATLAGREADIAMQAAAPPSAEETRARRLELESIVDDRGNRRYSDAQINEMNARGIYGKAAGNMNAAARSRMIEEETRRKQELAKSERDIPIGQTDVTQRSQAIVGTESSGNDYGLRQPNMTVNQAEASKGKYAVVSLKQADTIEKVTGALVGLNKIQELFEYRGSPEGDWWRTISGLTQTGREFFGTDDISSAKVSALSPLVSNSLEILENEFKLPSASTGVAKKIAAGNYAGANSAIAAAQEVAQFAKQQINRMMNQPSEAVTKELQTPTQKRQSQQAPTVGNLKKAAGATPKPAKDAKGSAESVDVAESIMLPIIETLIGMKDLNAPIESSKNWADTSKKLGVDGTVTGRQLVETGASLNVAKMKAKGIPDADKYLVVPTDDIDAATAKLENSAAILRVKKPRGTGKLGPTVQ